MGINSIDFGAVLGIVIALYGASYFWDSEHRTGCASIGWGVGAIILGVLVFLESIAK